MVEENRRVYFYDGAWREYIELHDNYGITLAPSTPITLYNNNLHPVSGWVDTTTNNTWVIADSQWYTPENIPYWKKLDSSTVVYLIGEPINLDTYKLRSSELYMYNGSLVGFDYMHDNYGITTTPSIVYSVNNGIITCWYNPNITDKPYWDVELKRWLVSPPEHGSSGSLDMIGSTSTFFYVNPSGAATQYGTLVSGADLTPVSLNMPNSGELSCSISNTVILTGTWRILTESAKSSKDSPCIVSAIKVSDNEYSTSDSTSSEHTEDIELNL